MPNFHDYVYISCTITFKPTYTVTDKYKLIENLFHVFRRCDNWQYSVEYHKYPVNRPKAGLNNPCAPHVHATLKLKDNSFRLGRVNKIEDELRKYGRTQIVILHTQEDLQDWNNYIYKDVVQNNLDYQYIHFRKREEVLNQTITALLQEEITQVIDERKGIDFNTAIELVL